MRRNPFQGAGVGGRLSQATQRRRNPREKGTRPQEATQGLRRSFHSAGNSQAAPPPPPGGTRQEEDKQG